MLKEITYFNCPGQKVKHCKDMLYCRENGEEGFYSLADGVNSSNKSHVGARAIQKALADFWEQQPNYFFETSNSEIRRSLIEIIQKVIYNLTKEQEKDDDFSSTLLVLCISRRLNKYRWFHIGDGMIVKESEEDVLEILSHPQNGITKQFTFTTTSKNLERFLRIDEGSIYHVKRFMIFTDGAMKWFYKERKLTENGEEFLKKGMDVYFRILQQLEPADDYSMLTIKL